MHRFMQNLGFKQMHINTDLSDIICNEYLRM